MDLIQVEILGLSSSSSSGGAFALVLRELDGTRQLPIIIGGFEAQAIALELENIEPPRPMTHDLLREVFSSVNAEVSYVVINELRDGTFFARVTFTHEGNESELDARPSDAVALAVRVEAPIYVTESVLEEAGIPSEDAAAAESSAELPVEDAEPVASTPLEDLNQKLKKAIEDENYEQAAILRDEIEKNKDS